MKEYHNYDSYTVHRVHHRISERGRAAPYTTHVTLCLARKIAMTTNFHQHCQRNAIKLESSKGFRGRYQFEPLGPSISQPEFNIAQQEA